MVNHIYIQQFREELNHAVELLNSFELSESGSVLNKLYASLRLNQYKQRRAKGHFDKVFWGLHPDDILSLLLNRSALCLNINDFSGAISCIQWYKKLAHDFRIKSRFDFSFAMNEIDIYRRKGNNGDAIKLCDKLLSKDLAPRERISALLKKGDIDASEHYNKFKINCLSQALGEAETGEYDDLISRCYMELSKLVGPHYPALGLSFLWKARIHFEKIHDAENTAFCMTQMAIAYFTLWNCTNDKRFIEADTNLVNEDINRDSFRHSGARATFDRQKGIINRDLKLIKSALSFFESIHATEEVYITAEAYSKVALELNDSNAAREGIEHYKRTAAQNSDSYRLRAIQTVDIKNAKPQWAPPKQEKELPNLLDVLEAIAYDEEWFHLEKGPFRNLYPTHYNEGEFTPIMMDDDQARLYPCTLVPFRYYRGQSDVLEGKKCQPSLYRGLTESEIFHERLCVKELENLLSYYPLTQVFTGLLSYDTPEGPKPLSLMVDSTALAQHYGIKTDVLDLTADKWVAAFFASTKYENGEYEPYTDNGEGVMYVYNHMHLGDQKTDPLSAVGMQPFSRPGCQAGLVYRMGPDEDFNEIASRKFVFKHDPDISELIFNYCNRSKKLFPKEILEDKVKQIREGRTHSRWAYTLTLAAYYPNTPAAKIEQYLKEAGITLKSAPPVMFTQEEYEDFNEMWNRTKYHLFDSIRPVIQYEGSIEKEE